MKFGVSLVPHNLKETAASARLAEDLGFDYVGIPDSQSLWKELYLSLGVVSGATRTVGIGPTVTNSLTRHPAVPGNRFGSVELAPGPNGPTIAVRSRTRIPAVSGGQLERRLAGDANSTVGGEPRSGVRRAVLAAAQDPDGEDVLARHQMSGDVAVDPYRQVGQPLAEAAADRLPVQANLEGPLRGAVQPGSSQFGCGEISGQLEAAAQVDAGCRRRVPDWHRLHSVSCAGRSDCGLADSGNRTRAPSFHSRR